MYVYLLLFFVLVVVLFVIYRRRETYVLPDFSAMGGESDICPNGFVLACVSKSLEGISETIPFPESLPQPCEQEFTPLCLPDPINLKAPSPEYLVKKS